MYVCIYVRLLVYVHMSMHVCMCARVAGVMKIGNTVHTAGIKPAPLVFWPSVLTIIPSRLPDIITRPMPSCLCD